MEYDNCTEGFSKYQDVQFRGYTLGKFLPKELEFWNHIEVEENVF